jgi:hypothetical protein
MASNGKPQTLLKGDCDYCPTGIGVHVTVVRGDNMCDECLAKESAVVASTRIIETSRKTDDKVTLKSDIFTAATTSFIELFGAVQNNPDIKPEDKRYAMAQLAAERIQKIDATIFEMDKARENIGNERLAWLKNTQELVASLHAEQQTKFKQYSMNYKPQQPSTKTIKKVAKGTSPKVTSHNDIKAICTKYGADVTIVKMMMVARKISAEQAAQEYARKHAD